MDNEILIRRRLILILVGVSVVIFIGLVWLIAANRPWNLLGLQNPTHTAGLQLTRDCTHPVTYWIEHPELYPPQVFIGGVTYQETELEALLLDDSPDLSQQLKTQLAVVFLNNQYGADQSTIETTVFDAYGWLEQHPAGSQLTNAELTQGRQLFQALEAYNLGLAGVAACEGNQVSSKTSTNTQTSTRVVTVAFTQTSTPTPGASPSPTIQLATPTITTFLPSNTPVPPTQPPSRPSQTPTRYIPPPTFTATAQAPSPTNTAHPTPSYTPFPTPTSTYTPFPVPTDTPTGAPSK
jgi:hypothetical protein